MFLLLVTWNLLNEISLTLFTNVLTQQPDSHADDVDIDSLNPFEEYFVIPSPRF